MIVHFQEINRRSGSIDLDSNLKYRRTFQVLTDNPQDGPSVVLDHPFIPELGDQYEVVDTSTGVPVSVVDNEAYVSAIEVDQDDDNFQNWTITVDYEGVEDPLSIPADVDFDPVPFQKALVDDVNDEPVVNTAGDPFENGVTVDRHRFRLTIVKNVLDFDHVEALDYMDSLNQEPFLGHPPGTCKLVLGAKRERRKGLADFYWRRKAVIDIDTAGWKVKLRNAGYRSRLVSEGKPVPIVDLITGAKPSTPVLLDGGGALLLTGDPPVIAGPTLDGFDGYETRDWTPLALEY